MGTPDADLDAILGLQISVAWAGEARAQPRRLGWWQTDLVDDTGGGDLFARLTPRTQAWAKLEALREAARRVDERTRLQSAVPDRTVTLYRFGFELDARLRERLTAHKRAGTPPADVLGKFWAVADRYDATAFATWCKGLAPRPKTEDAPNAGRRLAAPPAGPLALARALVSSLVPLTSEYPMPHARVES